MKDELIVNFERPPVVEVVAGVAFEGLAPDAAPHLAAFWSDRLRTSFPKVEQQPPYNPPRETFGSAPVIPQVTVDFGSSFPPTRLWASSVDGAELIQLQPGWFACNWRKVGPGAEYDHWPNRREAFSRLYRQLSEYVSEHTFGSLKVTQAEVSYINHIYPNDLWNTHSQIERIFTFGAPEITEGRFERASIEAQFALVDDKEPIGRLHAKVQPAFARDGRTPIYVLELTARGPIDPSGDDLTGTLTFMDRGRRAIVQTFLQATRDDMKKRVWGMQA